MPFRSASRSLPFVCGLLASTCRQCCYSGDDSQGVLTIPPDLRRDVIAVHSRAGESAESVPQHAQPLGFAAGCGYGACPGGFAAAGLAVCLCPGPAIPAGLSEILGLTK